MRKQVKKDLGIFYCFDVVGTDRVRIGKTGDSVTDLKERQIKHNNTLRQNSEEEPQHELLFAVRSSDIGADEDDIKEFFNRPDEIIGNRTTARCQVPHHVGKSKKIADEYRKKSSRLMKWINEVRDLDFAATFMDDVYRIRKLTVHNIGDWGPQCFQLDDFSGLFGINEVNPNTEKDYYTPQPIIGMAKKIMGDIDLDPATSKTAQFGKYDQKGVCAKHYYTLSANKNGLFLPWDINGIPSRVFLNPPWGQWASWCEKVIQEIERGHIEQLFMIVSGGALEQVCFSELHNRMYFCKPIKRLKYWGERAAAPTIWTAFFYYGPNGNKLKQEMSDFGLVYDPLQLQHIPLLDINSYSSDDKSDLTEFMNADNEDDTTEPNTQ